MKSQKNKASRKNQIWCWKKTSWNKKNWVSKEDLSVNTKMFKMCSKTLSIPPTVHLAQTSIKRCWKACELFNQYAASVLNYSNIIVHNERMSELNTINCTEERISKILRKINPDKLNRTKTLQIAETISIVS